MACELLRDVALFI